MNLLRAAFQSLAAIAAVCLSFAAPGALGDDEPFEPVSGQAGKDVVWVPTPDSTLEKMLDLARITPQDFVMDLGSGDGRNVIAAARRGARSLGVEYNPQMVALSQRAAAREGVADRAKFVQGDMFEADISQATALALFLLPDNLRKLEPKFRDLRPGTRIVVNTFGIDGWTAERTEDARGDCGAWCAVMLYIVPAKVGGSWRLAQGELMLKQKVQAVSGTLNVNGVKTPLEGRVRGDEISFTAAGTEYVGRVNGDTIEGLVKGGNGAGWRAVRAK